MYRPPSILSRAYPSPSVGSPTGDIVLAVPGWHIEGIEVDNLSGSYLFSPQLNLYIPPYTTGWSTSIIPGMAAVSMRYAATGPNGVGTSANIGSPFSMVLYNRPVTVYGGLAFLNPDGSALNVSATRMPLFVAARSGVGGAGAATASIAGLVAPGDLLVAIYFNRAGAGAITPPAGFTSRFENITGGVNDFVSLAYKIAAGNETVVTYQSTSVGGCIIIVGIYRQLTALGIGGSASAVGTGTACPNPSITSSLTPNVYVAGYSSSLLSATLAGGNMVQRLSINLAPQTGTLILGDFFSSTPNLAEAPATGALWNAINNNATVAITGG